MNKRGISPLLLTTFLILFAIIFGIIMLSLAKNPALELNTCAVDVNLQFLTIDEFSLLCQDESNIQFTVQNGALTEIESLIITINDQTNIELNQRIEKAGSYVAEIPFKEKVKKIEITPKIKINDKIEECHREKISSKDIPGC
jgi:hypothetical protein